VKGFNYYYLSDCITFLSASDNPSVSFLELVVFFLSVLVNALNDFMAEMEIQLNR